MIEVDKIVTDNKDNINKTFTNFELVTENLNKSNDEVKNIFNNFSSISDSLVKADISSTINKFDNILNSINQGEGSLTNNPG